MPTVVISMYIPKNELLRWYQGNANGVLAESIEGQIIRFPVNILQPYVTHVGIHGIFRIKYDEQGKFISIEQLD